MCRSPVTTITTNRTAPDRQIRAKPVWSRPRDAAGEAHGEETFRHLLAIEEERSRRSSNPFFLLLIGMKEQTGQDAGIDAMLAAALFASLSRGLRESDFIGWYCQGRIVGAVLVQVEKAPSAKAAQMAVQRVRAEMEHTVSPNAVERLQIRVYRRPAGLKPRS